ncbi:MAG: ABC transporter substrate-binding protein [Betaproteobacteria bacterium HGW-Betaproteobacteria-10]|nr:MAG: ABC transporter substrate-binding protein [Betaproteobacteria bacterium HGW-Betaproteobacteria-10]
MYFVKTVIFRLTGNSIVNHLFLCLCLLLVGPVQAEPDHLTISTNNTPMDRKALQSLSDEAFRRIGQTFQLISLPSERSLLAANLGEVDGEGLRVAGLSSQYPDLIQVPEPYIRISFTAFARDANIQVNAGWSDLKPYRLAFITGWKMFEANTAGAAHIYRLEQAAQMFRMLNEGRIDVALYTLNDGVALTRDLGMKNIRPLTPSLKDVDLYLYLHKRHAALVPQLASALRQMKADGTQQRILKSIANQP